jgi:hypothetical protein
MAALRCSVCGADVFFLSAAAKLGATVVTYPLLLVKARLQSAGKHTASDRKYSGTANAIERIYKTEGAAAPTASLAKARWSGRSLDEVSTLLDVEH